jgi:hypothetical protein
MACSQHEFSVCEGRWDRNRVCTLRFWSLLPFVQLRSAKYTNGLEMALFDGPKCLEVPPTFTGVEVKIGVHATGDSSFDWMPVVGADSKIGSRISVA